MIKQKLFAILFIGSLLFFYACRKADEVYIEKDAEWLSGGKQTFFDVTNSGFDHIFNGLTEREEENHEIGDAAFDAVFVTAPAPLNAGLGPIYNNVSCSGCHVNDGRGKPPVAGEKLSSMLFRISIPGANPHGGPNPVPGFGGQFHPRAIAGKLAEGDIDIQYMAVFGQYADGSKYALRQPFYTIKNILLCLAMSCYHLELPHKFLDWDCSKRLVMLIS